MLRHTSASLCCVALATLATAQQFDGTTTVNQLGQTVTVSLPAGFFKTPPAREWPTVDDAATPARERKKQRNDFNHNTVLNEAALLEADGALQTAYPKSAGRAPIINFNGQNGSGAPPDPTGAAGPNHYVQGVNLSYKVYSKTGSSLSGSLALSSLWPGSQDAGDPIVLYDRHADRWFISQFNFSPNRMLIAVSETGDPLGAYYTYSYTFSQFPDYPKFSVWWDGYYFTSNSNKTAVVFDRTKMLAGDPTAQMVALTAPNNGNNFFSSVLPADADGPLPPNGTPCYFFNLEDNAWGNPADQIRVYEMTTDWVTPGNTVVVSSQTIPTAAFNTALGSGFDNIAQPGTTQKLDAVSEIFYFRAQHTRWTGYNSVVLCHVVDAGGDHAAVRWYELRDADDGNWTIHQQGTFNPDEGNRWMASIAMDEYGGIGLGYSCNYPDSTIHAGLRYTGRQAGDPLGQMTISEQVAVAGTAAQTGINRYGDYAHMSLDPDGSTFWFTGEWLSAGGNSRTRIFSFDIATSIGIEENTSEVAVADLQVVQANGALNVSLTGLRSDDELRFSVIGLDGKEILASTVQPLGKQWNSTVDVRSLSSGVYFVRLGKSGFQKVERIVIAK
ncbi:MAG: T9SS type A sorting domain-containing protein [Flavobacteriales bacterium]|nr:T9SS type A sorting domain-containing protein [Flavobacteriales bacterium]